MITNAENGSQNNKEELGWWSVIRAAMRMTHTQSANLPYADQIILFVVFFVFLFLPFSFDSSPSICLTPLFKQQLICFPSAVLHGRPSMSAQRWNILKGCCSILVTKVESGRMMERMMREEGRKLRGEDRFKRRVQEEPQVGEAQDVEIMAWKTIH